MTSMTLSEKYSNTMQCNLATNKSQLVHSYFISISKKTLRYFRRDDTPKAQISSLPSKFEGRRL